MGGGCCLPFEFYIFFSSRAAIIPADFAHRARLFCKIVFSCPILLHFYLQLIALFDFTVSLLKREFAYFSHITTGYGTATGCLLRASYARAAKYLKKID
jgi:hypothetical protein